MKDRVLLPAAISLWLQTLPQAEVTRIPDSGHFVQEDAPERAVPELVRFARTVQGPA
jgi:pimeloyl-ACP methyl ester carboxylesterase